MNRRFLLSEQGEHWLQEKTERDREAKLRSCTGANSHMQNQEVLRVCTATTTTSPAGQGTSLSNVFKGKKYNLSHRL